MTIETDLRTYILADGTVSGLVGTRMYPVTLPQDVTYPAISYEIASRVGVRDLDGPTGKARPRITINAWAVTTSSRHGYDTVRELANAIRKRINGFRGTMGSVRVRSVMLDNWFDDFEEEAGTSGVYRVFADYILSHEEEL